MANHILEEAGPFIRAHQYAQKRVPIGNSR